MNWIEWSVVLLALVVAGFMVIDGSRALWVGDYFTPQSGEHAGQLGPWSHVVAALGIGPRSTLMKMVFVVFGSIWLLLIILFALGVRGAWWGMFIAAVASLWFLPFGTILGVVQIGLLFVVRRSFVGD